MNNNQNSLTNRDKEQMAQTTTAKGSGTATDAAEKVAAANRRLENEDTGPMTPHEPFRNDPHNGGGAKQTPQRDDSPLPIRSPKQENL